MVVYIRKLLSNLTIALSVLLLNLSNLGFKNRFKSILGFLGMIFKGSFSSLKKFWTNLSAYVK